MRVTAWAVLVVVAAAGCTSAPRPAPTGTPSASQGPGPVSSAAVARGPARELVGRPLVGPTGLRLLIEGTWYDVDAGSRRAAGVTSWLRPVAGPPILVIEPPPPASPAGPGAITIRRVGTGTPPTIRVETAFDRYRLAPSVDGRAVWVSEYRGRTSCTLREQGLDGRVRRPARPVACGVEPLLETPDGLWVSRWVNVYSLNGRNVDFTEPTYALLDPRTLAVKASYEEAFVVGARHVLTMDDQEQNLMLRDVRTGSAVPLTRPGDYVSFHVFNSEFPVARVSPDGRYALFRLGSTAQSPQVIDLWVVDLSTAAWQRVPGMPVGGALKDSSEAWAPDGRLVLVGQYGVDKPVLATWRPGEPQVAVRPDPLPAGIYDGGLGLLYVATGAGVR